MFKKTLIIGLGLIGGSFAKALKKHKISAEIFACDPDAETLDFAQGSGVIEGGFEDLSHLSDELQNFDLIVVASPLATYEEVFSVITKSKALVIDLGSIKELHIENAPKNFIPCHPIAGSQNSGFEFADENLFASKKFIICSQNSEAKNVAQLAKQIGAEPEFLKAEEHDEIYALMSHLPQFLSFLTKEFSPKNIKDPFFQSAFRLDDSDPELWSDIFAMNEIKLEKFYLLFFDNLEKNVEQLTKLKADANLKDEKFDEKFFADNFSAIFFRALIAKSLLEIEQVKTFKNYAGSGFKDFTSIASCLNYDQKKLQELITKNRPQITKFFNSIS